MSRKLVVLAVAASVSLGLPGDGAQAVGRHSGGAHAGHHHHHGHWRGGVWLGLGLGWGYSPYYGWPYAGAAYAPVIVERRAVFEVPDVPAAPDPSFVPRHGQDIWQAERDRQECNRWTMTRAQAVADAAVFHRTAMECIASRGYDVR